VKYIDVTKPQVFNRLDVTEEEVLKRAEELLTRPDNANFSDPDLWDTHALMFDTPNITMTRDYVWQYARYLEALDDLKISYPDDVSDYSFSGWGYRDNVAIKIRVIDDEGNLTPAFVEAVEIENTDDYGYDRMVEIDDRFINEDLDALAKDLEVDRDVLKEVVIDDLQVEWDNAGGFYMPDGVEEEIIKLCGMASSTWEAHYYAGQYHTPEFCWYCARAEVFEEVA